MPFSQEVYENANKEFYYAVINLLTTMSEEIPPGVMPAKVLQEVRKVYIAAGEVDNQLVLKKQAELEAEVESTV